VVCEVQDDHATAVETSRPADAASFGGEYYKVFDINLTWREASRKCQEMGARLAVIDTGEENAFVAELAAKTTANTVWIGGSYDPERGQWHWVNGKRLTFTNWGPRQPNGFNNVSNPEHFISMTVPGRGNPAAAWNGKWADLPDRAYDTKNGFVCEWD
jgi:hypothetical protein